MSKDLHKGAKARQFLFAKENRKKATQAEDFLWQHLRGRKLMGFKFRRQHPICNFIADFYCHEVGLAIELDGEIHNDKEAQDFDAGRSAELQNLGIKVLRFKNEEVLKNVVEVLEEVGKHLIPGPSPQGEGSLNEKDTII
ncbi:endonuclease domain-containing protein [Adhaeribacter sp. BT258]|uniref:Endonuclease domain-containing protein n=1 Tax=Adhaeribacter terrigena TaxID=2793070 RepID=A0ABS1BZP9_9BACT|nr:endonuclease domain-containing protein [Adhaeribacter terrigena]MBK0402617.1 endonuclease domain-containing protein [Adhaeribacter terrigena]